MPYRVTIKPEGGPVREVFRTGFAIVAVRFLMRLTGVETAERYETIKPEPSAHALSEASRRARFVPLNREQAERYYAAILQKGSGSQTIIARGTVYTAERIPGPSAEYRKPPADHPAPGYPRGPVDLTKLTKAPHDKTRAVSEPGRLGHFKGAA